MNNITFPLFKQHFNGIKTNKNKKTTSPFENRKIDFLSCNAEALDAINRARISYGPNNIKINNNENKFKLSEEERQEFEAYLENIGYTSSDTQRIANCTNNLRVDFIKKLITREIAPSSDDNKITPDDIEKLSNSAKILGVDLVKKLIEKGYRSYELADLANSAKVLETYQVKKLIEEGYNTCQISNLRVYASNLGTYQVKKLIEEGYDYSEIDELLTNEWQKKREKAEKAEKETLLTPEQLAEKKRKERVKFLEEHGLL